MQFIKRLQRILIYILPAVLFFSYYPVITLGSAESMNFELSIPLIWLVLFSVISLIDFRKIFRYFGYQKILLAALIPAYLTISCFWSKNSVRAILTTGIFALVVFSLLSIIYIINTDKLFKKPTVIKSLLFSGVAVSIFCWLQCVLDLVGINRDASLLCLGCTYTAFGFPHPNGFAIEPQFMGNLLLAPTLLSYYLLVTKPKSIKLKARFTIPTTIFLTATLFLTFSRGAIYAFSVAIAIWLIVTLVRSKKIRQLILPIGLLVSSFCISLVAQGTFAAISPTSDTFLSGATKAIHQLSLGRIDIRPEYVKNIKSENSPTSQDFAPADSLSASTDASLDTSTNANSAASVNSTFSGYVTESTDIRLDLTNIALDTWSSSVTNILFGVGIGGAGVSLYARHPELGSSKEIVQNEYASLLLELGLVGIILILFVLFKTIKINQKTITKNQNTTSILSTLLLSYALTLLFFSGLPNALHIYLLPALLFCSLS